MDLPEFDEISPEAKNFIRKLLTYEYKERPSIDDCLKNDWVLNNKGT